MTDLIEVLYEDNHLLVANKSSGLLTQPSGTDQDSLESRCKKWIKEKYQKAGNVFLEAVHRLDKPASGIVVFAKTSKALSRLNESMREKRSSKRYYALVEGVPKLSELTLEHYLVHDDFQARVASKNVPSAKKCRLHYWVKQHNKSFALLDILLETGRYHQIRAQLSAISHPIVGDHKYGAQVKFVPEGVCLHHYSLEIPHPTKETLVKIESPIPATWSKMLE